MKYILRILSIFILISVVLNSCKKDEDEDGIIVDPPTESTLGANDETARMEYEKSLDELFDALNNTGINTGKMAGPDSNVILPCGVVRIDSTTIPGIYKFVYDSTCGVRVLSGSISASITNGPWVNAGAVLELNFQAYQIQYLANNEILTFDGPLYIENETGGTIFSKTLVTHKVYGTIDITFDLGDTRQWTITKRRVYNKTPAIVDYNFELQADPEFGVAETGTTIDGDPFTTSITQNIVWNNCGASILGPFVATEGTLFYQAPLATMTGEAGYTFNNGAVNKAPGDGCSSQGYKLTYTILGQTIVTFQYY